MSTWAERAKLHLSQKAPKGTDETDETPNARLYLPKKGQRGTDETDKTPISSVSSVHAGPFLEIQDSANDPAPRYKAGSLGDRAARELAYWSDDQRRIAYRNYHAHHFNCRLCIAAGRGSQYGQRCDEGLVLLAICNAPNDEGAP